MSAFYQSFIFPLQATILENRFPVYQLFLVMNPVLFYVQFPAILKWIFFLVLENSLHTSLTKEIYPGAYFALLAWQRPNRIFVFFFGKATWILNVLGKGR